MARWLFWTFKRGWTVSIVKIGSTDVHNGTSNCLDFSFFLFFFLQIFQNHVWIKRWNLAMSILSLLKTSNGLNLYLRAQKEIEKGITQNSLPVTIIVTCYSISQGKRCVWQFQGQNRPIFILSSAHVMPKLVQANLWCIMTTHQPPFAIVIGCKQTTPSVQTRHWRLHEAIQPLLTSQPALFQSSWGHCLWNMTVGSIQAEHNKTASSPPPDHIAERHLAFKLIGPNPFQKQVGYLFTELQSAE